MREVILAPRPVYCWEKIPLNISGAFSWSHSCQWDRRRSQTATRAGKGCYRKTCSRGSVQEFHFAPFQLHFLLWQHSLDVSIATLAVLWLPCTGGWFYALKWTVCCWSLMCNCEVQLSSWHKAGQFFEHAFRLCTIPLVLYNIIECCNVKCMGCTCSEKDQRYAHFS
jgi:hypothetical protein